MQLNKPPHYVGCACVCVCARELGTATSLLWQLSAHKDNAQSNRDRKGQTSELMHRSGEGETLDQLANLLIFATLVRKRILTALQLA